VAAIEVVDAEFVVGRGGGEEVIADLKDVAADGDDGLAMPAVRHDAAVSARASGSAVRPGAAGSTSDSPGARGATAPSAIASSTIARRLQPACAHGVGDNGGSPDRRKGAAVVIVPPHLYKYVTADVARRVIESQTTRWSSPLEFNDLDDARCDWRTFFHLDDDSLDDFVAVTQSLLESPDPLPALRDWWLHLILAGAKVLIPWLPGPARAALVASMRARLNAVLAGLRVSLKSDNERWLRLLEGTRIFCLTERPDFPTMWDTFGDRHQGAVLRFTPRAHGDSNFDPMPVRYSAEPAVVADRQVWIRHAIGLETISTDDTAEKIIYTKRLDRSGEREWRCWLKAADAGGCADRYTFVPFHPDELTAVYIGREMSPATRNALLSVSASRVPHAEVREEP
jgi:hypothetical protein